jgi:hypothetical protein
MCIIGEVLRTVSPDRIQHRHAHIAGGPADPDAERRESILAETASVSFGLKSNGNLPESVAAAGSVPRNVPRLNFYRVSAAGCERIESVSVSTSERTVRMFALVRAAQDALTKVTWRACLASRGPAPSHMEIDASDCFSLASFQISWGRL